MNNHVSPSIVKMEPEALKSLLTEVKETVATEVALELNGKTSFTSVNMWKIRTTVKSANQRLRRIN